MTPSAFHIIEKKAGVLFIQDLNLGGRSVTNDAEQVLAWCREKHGKDIRVVYKDTDNEWWEMIREDHPWEGHVISFERWHGLEWDILKR